MQLDAARRKALISDLREDTIARPWSTLLISVALFAVYFALLYLVMHLENPVLKGLCAMWAGLYVANLLACAHDAAHNAFFKKRGLNRIFATVLMLPSLQPYSVWQHEHNFVHHRYVAQLGVDNTYPPLTPEEYLALPFWRRAYYRFLRSLIGQQFWYFLEITVPFMLFPYIFRRTPITRRVVTDVLVVYAWAAFVFWFCLSTSMSMHPEKSAMWHWMSAGIFGLLLPTFSFSMVLTFLSVFQHTSPDVKWITPDGEPTAPDETIAGTVHVVLPEWIDMMFMRNMQHQAHHLNVHIDLHALQNAQTKVGAAYDKHLARVWTPKYHLDVVRLCKLYDPEQERWLTFKDLKARQA